MVGSQALKRWLRFGVRMLRTGKFGLQLLGGRVIHVTGGSQSLACLVIKSTQSLGQEKVKLAQVWAHGVVF